MKWKHTQVVARMGDTVAAALERSMAVIAGHRLCFFDDARLSRTRWGERASQFLSGLGATNGCLNKAGGIPQTPFFNECKYLLEKEKSEDSSWQRELTLASSSYVSVLLSIEQTQQVMSQLRFLLYTHSPMIHFCLPLLTCFHVQARAWLWCI